MREVIFERRKTLRKAQAVNLKTSVSNRLKSERGSVRDLFKTSSLTYDLFAFIAIICLPFSVRVVNSPTKTIFRLFSLIIIIAFSLEILDFLGRRWTFGPRYVYFSGERLFLL